MPIIIVRLGDQPGGPQTGCSVPTSEGPPSCTRAQRDSATDNLGPTESMRSARSRRCSSSCSPVPTLLRTLNLSCRPPLGTRRGKLTASTPETLRAREEITRTFGRWIGMRCQARSAPRGEPHKRFASTQRAQVQRVKCSSYFGTSPQQHACISSDEVRDFRHCATCRKARATPQSALWTASIRMAGKTTIILAGWTGMNVVV